LSGHPPAIVSEHSLVEPTDPDAVFGVDGDVLDPIAQRKAVENDAVRSQHPCVSLAAGSGGDNEPEGIASVVM
jgi:hypothetical protein